MFQEIFVYSALIGGLALLLQVGMMFLGLDDIFEGADGDAGGGFDFDDVADAGDGGSDSGGFWLLEMISIRTLTAAVTFFGLAGWICLASNLSTPVSLTVAIGAGYAAMYSVYWALKQMMKLEQSGNVDVRKAVGQSATVYVPIPADRSAAGKVQMKLQDRTVEYLAMTEDSQPLKTGETVVVVELVSNDTLLVQRVAEAVEEKPVEA